MENMPIGAFLIFATIIGITLLPVKLSLRFSRVPNKVTLYMRITLWFIPISLKFVNPLTKTIYNLSQNRFWKKKAPQDISAREVPWTRFFVRIINIQQVFGNVIRESNHFFKRVARPIRITKLNLYTEIGVGDAALTAMAVGMYWSVLGMVYTVVSHFFNIQDTKNDFKVIPNYQITNLLRIDYSCIFEFRLGHIIIVFYQILRSAAKIRTLIRRISK